MSQSNRGAAQVSLMWAIALLVVAIVAIFLAYSATAKLSETQAAQAAAQQAAIEARSTADALRDQYRELDERLAQTIAEKDAEIGTIQNATASLRTRNEILSDRLNGVQRRAESPDGEILAANLDIGKAWIDIGRTHRLVAGLEFDVLDQTTGSVKGRLRVSSVEDARAEAQVLNVQDRFNPIVPGDRVRNPVFDPTRQPTAVLLGNGFGSYSASDMKVKLAEVGVQVADKVSVETDYLLLGTPFFDEDTGEMIPWDQRPTYQSAEALAVQIVPRRDWLAWLGL